MSLLFLAKEPTFDILRYEMTTSQLIDYAKRCNIELSTTDGKHKKKIAKEIWNELNQRGFN